MKKLVLSLAALCVFAMPSVVLADQFTFQAPPTTGESTGPGSGPNQVDLDHHNAYAWRVGGNATSTAMTQRLATGHQITRVTLSFTSMQNWDEHDNRLFIHLLDNASTTAGTAQTSSGGVGTIRYVNDVNVNQSPVTDISDYFNGANALTGNNANTFLTSQSFDDSATPNFSAYPLAAGWTYDAVNKVYTYSFTAAQLQTFSTYFLNDGIFALGLDSDCHFWNNGIQLTVTTQSAPIPEPATMTLLGTGLAGLYARRRRQKKAHSEA